MSTALPLDLEDDLLHVTSNSDEGKESDNVPGEARGAGRCRDSGDSDSDDSDFDGRDSDELADRPAPSPYSDVAKLLRNLATMPHRCGMDDVYQGGDGLDESS